SAGGSRGARTAAFPSAPGGRRPRRRRRRPEREPPPQRRARSYADAGLHVGKPRGRSAVRHRGELARLTLAAIREAVQPPALASAEAVQRRPEDGSYACVRGVAEQPAELAALDLPCDLRAELEVQPL